MIKDLKDHKIKCGTRTIPESICDNPKCKFYGKPAAQGVCFSKIPYIAEAYWDLILKQGEELLAEMKRLHGKRYVKGKIVQRKVSLKSWIKQLEGHLVCDWANHQSVLDELIRVRAENAQLRLKLGKWKR